MVWLGRTWSHRRSSAADGVGKVPIHNPLWLGQRRGLAILKNSSKQPQGASSPLWAGFREAMANGERILGTTVAEQAHHAEFGVDWVTVRVDPATVPRVTAATS